MDWETFRELLRPLSIESRRCDRNGILASSTGVAQAGPIQTICHIQGDEGRPDGPEATCIMRWVWNRIAFADTADQNLHCQRDTPDAHSVKGVHAKTVRSATFYPLFV